MTGGLDKMFCAGANIRMLAQSVARLEGELLQVHQRDPQRHRGRDRELAARPGSPRSTAPRPAAATSSRWPATRSCSSTTAPRRCQPARGAAARRAARHRRPDPRGRQAARPQGPRRPVRHQVRGLPRRHRGRVGPGRRDRPAQELGRGDRHAGPAAAADASARRGGTASPSPRSTATEAGDEISYPYVDRDPRPGRPPGRHHRRRPVRRRRPRTRPRCSTRAWTTGRSRSPARWTTWCCGCAPTSRTSAPGCSAPSGDVDRVLAYDAQLARPRPTTGSSTRPPSTSSAPSSGSTSPAAAWSR